MFRGRGEKKNTVHWIELKKSCVIKHCLRILTTFCPLELCVMSQEFVLDILFLTVMKMVARVQLQKYLKYSLRLKGTKVRYKRELLQLYLHLQSFVKTTGFGRHKN